MPNVKKATGKVSRAGGKYVVTVGRKKYPLPVGTLISKELISDVVGTEVQVAISGNSLIGIIGRRPPILCYFPLPDIFDKVEPQVQDTLRKAYTQAGILGD